MPGFIHSRILKSLLLLGALFTSARLAPAQALVTAQRGAEITPFAQTTLIDPDWGPSHNLGYTAGLDYTRFVRSIVQPSLEMRMTSANGSTVSERSYVGGLKLQTSFRGIRPYATFLAGYGDIYFTHPINGYLSDNSFVYSVGAGAEFSLGYHLAARFDFTHQQWNIDPQTLTPVTLGVGLSYRVPFRSDRVE